MIVDMLAHHFIFRCAHLLLNETEVFGLAAFLKNVFWRTSA